MRNTTCFLLLALLTTAPLALAQESKEEPTANETRPDDAAWVEDCPPDMMCAATTSEEEPARGPEDGSCENCRGEDAEPVLSYGNDTCIECSGPAPDQPSGTCMDGADANESCRDDVQYFGNGPDSAPYESGPINSHAPAGGEQVTASEETKAVPAPALAVGILAFAAAALLALPRRR